MDVGNGKVALKSYHGRYLTCENDGDVYSVSNLNDWEKWEKVWLRDGVGFKSFHGGYLRAYPNNWVDCAATVPDDWEIWHMY